jgi:hypothetical protein
MRKVSAELALVSPLIGFKPNVREFSAVNRAVQEVINEYESPLGQGILGDNWEQHYNTMLQKMEEAGISNLIADLQKQVDEYLAANGIDKHNSIAR